MSQQGTADAYLLQIRRLAAELGSELVTSANLPAIQFVELVEKLDELLSTGASEPPEAWRARHEPAAPRGQAVPKHEQMLKFAARDYAYAFGKMVEDCNEQRMDSCDYMTEELKRAAWAFTSAEMKSGKNGGT